MANQVQIPVIQTEDKELVQVQQNVNKVLRNINNQVTLLNDKVQKLEPIGEIKLSALTLGEWQTQTGDNWIEANGQSSVGTKYAVIYGFTTVPNISITGTNAFIRVN